MNQQEIFTYIQKQYLIEMYHLAPAKHMDQKHWLAVPLDGSVSDSKVLDLLDMSYDLVDGQATDSTPEEKD